MTKKLIPLAVPDVGKEELEEINKVFKTGFLTEGATTQEFEKAVAEWSFMTEKTILWKGLSK